jgi:protein phosphatase 4 regulatory subunit 3
MEKHLTENNLIEPILSLLYETMPKDNLLNSACLELFEFIRRENRVELINHVVENYREKLSTVTYVDTFQNLIQRYEQLHAPKPADASFTSQDTESMALQSNRVIANGGRWHGLKEGDVEEDAYFNSSDGDDDEPLDSLGGAIGFSSKIGSRPQSNGAGSVKPLVDYPDDDEEEMDILSIPTSTLPSQKQTPNSPVPSTPPDRHVEKRRREDDEEEDELGKLLTSTKRRSSVSSTSSTGSATSTDVRSDAAPASGTGQTLRKRKSTLGGKEGPAKKIAISLAVKNTDGAEKSPNGDEKE